MRQVSLSQLGLRLLIAVRYRKLLAICMAVMVSGTMNLEGQQFTDMGDILTNVDTDLIEFADYDNDGDLDFILFGNDTLYNRLSILYENTGSFTFIPDTLDINFLTYSSVDWADYDTDGDLDFLLTGFSYKPGDSTLLFTNDGTGVFSATDHPFINIQGDADWGDYDNDGDLDLILSGECDTGNVTVLYRNEGDMNFTEIVPGLPVAGKVVISWGDYDNDGDLDILHSCCRSHPSFNISRIYRNEGNERFINIDAGFDTLSGVLAQWGDYENDGDLDVLHWHPDYGNRASIYKNEGDDVFTELDYLSSSYSYRYSAFSWGDYDVDGDLDILAFGEQSPPIYTFFGHSYRNDGFDVYTKVEHGFPGIFYPTIRWADMDNDRDLDFVAWGYVSNDPVTSGTKFYRNNETTTNYKPTTPKNLTTTRNGRDIILSWEPSTDNPTPSEGLTYNVRIGLKNGTWDIKSAHARSDGYLTVPAMGNAGHDTSYVLENFGEYYIWWGVQAVDNSFVGSGFQNAWLEFAFTQTPSNLTEFHWGDGSWGDYDSDGDLDIIISGRDINTNPFTNLYRNEGEGAFNLVPGQFDSLYESHLAWGDYDNDNDLDLFIGGRSGEEYVSRIYKNSGSGVFAELPLSLAGSSYGSSAWGDYDNDGDLDLVVSGRHESATYHTTLYKNTGKDNFLPVSIEFLNIKRGAIAWVDYNTDGYLDLSIAGDTSDTKVFGLYKNNGDGSFSEISTGIALSDHPRLSWGDYDRDGDPDLLLSGGTFGNYIYRNDGNGTFTSVDIESFWHFTEAEWGDWDNDGDLDILAMSVFPSQSTILLSNEGNDSFPSYPAALPGIWTGDIEWGDYDNDLDLDILLTGDYISRIYENNVLELNSAPEPPAVLTVDKQDEYYLFSWNSGSDNETGPGALTYNLRIGTSPGGTDLKSPHTAEGSGARLIRDLGNVQQSNSFLLQKDSIEDIIYWSVQSIDGAYAASAFSEEQVCNKPFSSVAAELGSLKYTCSAFGDYDNDEDLDLLVSGAYLTEIFRNDGNSHFVNINAGLTGIADYGSSVWGDFDNDGDLDVMISGITNTADYITKLYENTGGDNFNDIGIEIAGVAGGSSSLFCDFNMDGRLDIIICGLSETGRITKIYKNEGHKVFTEVESDIPGLNECYLSAGDYDNDGDPDILISGNNGIQPVTDVYRNNGSFEFSKAPVTLPGIRSGTANWTDFNMDGYLDIFLGGSTASGIKTALFRNEGDHSFTEIDAGFDSLGSCTFFSGDYDSDGDPDILMTGSSFSGEPVTRVYRYDGGNSFYMLPICLPDLKNGSGLMADHDNDGDLDVFISGNNGTQDISRIYLNERISKNTPPEAPSDLYVLKKNDMVRFNWSKSHDEQTGQSALSYNLRAGSTPGGNDLIYTSSNNTGKRLLNQFGNAYLNNNLSIGELPVDTLYWSVQSVDNSYSGSPFADEKEFHNILSINSDSLPGIENAFSAWGDYDNDGDYDLLLAGRDGMIIKSALYKNNGMESFTQVPFVFEPLEKAAASWADYDADGDLDLFLSGNNGTQPFSAIYRNDNNDVFTRLSVIITGVEDGASDWADFDSDGDLDLMLVGFTGTINITKLYRNDGGNNFSSITTGIPGVSRGDMQWGDYNNDGDPDIIICGSSDAGPITKIFKNDGNNNFTEISAGLSGIMNGTCCWGDYDNDGDPDVLLSGENLAGDPLTEIYNNEGGDTFTKVNPGLTGVKNSCSSWGDYDCDGDLDILLSGNNGLYPVNRLYSNNGSNSFSEINTGMKGYESGLCNWVDFDQDDDLDFFTAGRDSSGNFFSTLHKNNYPRDNTIPYPPTGLNATKTGDTITLSWAMGTDEETPSIAMGYNVRIGSKPGLGDIVPAHSLTNGFRTVNTLMNAYQNTHKKITGLEDSIYYFSVQSVDNSFAGSAFSDEYAIYLVLPPPEADDTVVCHEQAIPDLYADGISVRWYSNGELTDLVHSGNSYSAGIADPGVYTWYVTQTGIGDESDADTVTLTITSLPLPPVNNSESICIGEPVPILSSEGTDVKWYDDATLENLIHTGITYETGNTEIGTYTYYVTQTENLCESHPDSIILVINTLPEAGVADDDTLCESEMTLLNIGSDGMLGHTYTWIADPGGMISSEANPQVNPTVTTTYTLIETIDATACAKSDSVTIVINPNPVVSITIGQNPLDQGSSTNLNAAGADTFVWSPSTGLDNTTGAQVSASPTENTTYFLEGTDLNGCPGYDTLELFVYCPACEENTILVDTGEFSYGCGSKNVYMHGLNCTWTLYPDEIPKIYLYFSPDDFDVSSGDWVIVYNGAQASEDTLGKFNNDHPPSGNIEGGSSMFIEFITDGSTTGRGFQAKWSGDFIEGIADPNSVNIRIYPNPAVDMLNIESGTIQKADIRAYLYNNLGQMVLNRNWECKGEALMEKIDLEGLDPGIYHLILLTSDGQVKRKITIASK